MPNVNKTCYAVESFEDNKFYVMSGQGKKWSDFDGPFDSIEEGISFMRKLCCGDYCTPDHINGTILVLFKNNILDIAKNTNQEEITGKFVHYSYKDL